MAGSHAQALAVLCILAASPATAQSKGGGRSANIKGE
jgi:hypothetical protein